MSREPLFIRWGRISQEAQVDGTAWKVAVRWAGLVVIVAMLGLVVAFVVWAILATGGEPMPKHP